MQARKPTGYEKKFLHLAIIKVQRGEEEDTAEASYGSVVINLADFANVSQGSKKLAFRVSVGKDITAALARIGKTETPTLIITLTCAPATPGAAGVHSMYPDLRACQMSAPNSGRYAARVLQHIRTAPLQQARACSARLTEDDANLDMMTSHSSRGSRITTNLASFFTPPPRDAADAEAEDRQMAERGRQQALQQAQLARGAGGSGMSGDDGARASDGHRYSEGYTPPGYGQPDDDYRGPRAAAPDNGNVSTEPPSGLMRPATRKLVRVDSDGFEIDDDEDDNIPTGNHALAQQVNTAMHGTPRHESSYPSDDALPVSGHRRNASNAGGVVTSMRPTPSVRNSNSGVAAGNNSAGATPGSVTNYSPAEPVAEPSRVSSNAAAPRIAGQQSAAGSPAARGTPTASATPARRSTGKTGYIRGWLDSAEPAPGEGPSLALFTGRDGPDEATLSGLRGTGGQDARARSTLATVQDEPEDQEGMQDAGEHHEARALMVAQLSTSTNTDLRTVLEKTRIQAESDSYAQEVEERESQLGGRSPQRESSFGAAAAHRRNGPSYGDDTVTPDLYPHAAANGHSVGHSETNGAMPAGEADRDSVREPTSAALPSAPLPQSDVAAMDAMRGKASPPPSDTSRHSAKVRS